MSEWWSYRPSDFLMFSSRVYYRQIESFNADHWPLHIALFAVFIYLLFACFKQRTLHIRISFILLSGMWAFISLDYFRAYLVTIHWGVRYAIYAFLLQAVLLLLRGISGFGISLPQRNAVRWTGIALIMGALVVFPFLGVLSGRGYESAEVVGAMPTPTVIATLGFLLAAGLRRVDLVLMVVPVLWCLVDSVTVYTMRQPDWWVAPAMMVVTLTVAFLNRKQPSPATFR
jgi:hypothetical protein